MRARTINEIKRNDNGLAGIGAGAKAAFPAWHEIKTHHPEFLTEFTMADDMRKFMRGKHHDEDETRIHLRLLSDALPGKPSDYLRLRLSSEEEDDVRTSEQTEFLNDVVYSEVKDHVFYRDYYERDEDAGGDDYVGHHSFTCNPETGIAIVIMWDAVGGHRTSEMNDVYVRYR